MPFAQVHYPFSIKEEEFMKHYPADFIAEGLDQTRGWFYTLLVLSSAVTHKNCIKNCIVHGLVLAKDGKKMSKHLHNYTDPMVLADNMGVDAIRLYMINSQVVRAGNLKFNDKGVHDIIKDVLLPLYNSYRFLIQNASRWEKVSGKKFIYDEKMSLTISQSGNKIDKWIIAANQSLIEYIRNEMENYRLYNVVPRLMKFTNDLTNWYVRMNRSRIKGNYGNEDWIMSLNTLFEVLLNTLILLDPYIPFLTDFCYQNLRNGISKDSPLYKDSIHFLSIPVFDKALIDQELEKKVLNLEKVIMLGRQIRDNVKIPLKQILKSLTIINQSESYFEGLKEFEGFLKEELNVMNVNYLKNENEYVYYSAHANLTEIKERLEDVKLSKETIKKMMNLSKEEIIAFRNDKSLTVDKIILIEGDLTVKREFNEKYKNDKSIGCASDDFHSIYLDLTLDNDLKSKGFAREFASFIQKKRKKSSIFISDLIEIFYDDKVPEAKEVVNKEKELFNSILKAPIKPLSEFPSHYTPIIDDEFKYNTLTIKFKICFTPIKLHIDKIIEDFKDLILKQKADELLKAASNTNLERLKTEIQGKGNVWQVAGLNLESKKHFE